MLRCWWWVAAQLACLLFKKPQLGCTAAAVVTAGITRKFILTGLDHCCCVLDSTQAALQAPSVTPSHFEYFCLYNDELGRHEAYYQATAHTTIRLPAPAAAYTGPSAAAPQQLLRVHGQIQA
jgi:hypothetical protein